MRRLPRRRLDARPGGNLVKAPDSPMVPDLELTSGPEKLGPLVQRPARMQELERSGAPTQIEKRAELPLPPCDSTRHAYLYRGHPSMHHLTSDAIQMRPSCEWSFVYVVQRYSLISGYLQG